MSLFRKTQSALCAAGLVLSACTANTNAPEIGLTEEAATASATFVIVYKLEALPLTAASDIAAAGGTIVAKYPAFGVIVASSGTASFLTKMRANFWVDSVGPTTGAGISALPVKFPTIRLPRPVPPPPAPNSEPLAGMQWNMDLIHAAQARAITPVRKSVVVGVLDSGIDDSVPDLQGQVDASKSVTCIGGVANTDPSVWRYDVIGHGTHVAGIIGAKQNGVGTVGIAPGVTLAAVKLSEDGFVYPEAALCGLNWAATKGFDLVNASIFVDPWYYNCPSDPTQKAILTAMQRAVSYASRSGVTVIAAAANEQQDLAHVKEDPFSPTDDVTVPRTVNNSCKLIPVQLNDVVGVSAVGGDARLSFYSNYGLGSIDFAAPGGDFHVAVPGNASGQIVSPIPEYSYYYQVAQYWNGRVGIGCDPSLDPNDPNADTGSCAETYALLQGTSQATPHVTGVAALVLSKYGKLPTAALLAKMAAGATPKSCPANPYQPYPSDMPAETCESSWFSNGFYGSGLVDAYGAVKLF